MLAVIARLKVIEDKTEHFLAVMKELSQKVHTEEKGCLQYQLCRARDGNNFVMIERYADKTALKIHGETPHFIQAQAEFAKCLAARPEIEIFSVVE